MDKVVEVAPVEQDDESSSGTKHWPFDHGQRQEHRWALTGRCVRSQWRRCMGECKRWFFTDDAVNIRMCHVCRRGEVRINVKPATGRVRRD